MAIDTTSPRTRRALLAAAASGAAAAVAATIARVSPTAGANGDPVLVGQSHTGSSTTQIVSTTSGTVLSGFASGAVGTGVRGDGPTGVAGVGKAGGVGVNGTHIGGAGIGVRAFSASGHGLRVARGRIKVDEVSGVSTIGKGRRSVTVNPGVDINTSTFVLLTPKANLGSRGLWFTRQPAANTFRIHISARRDAPTKVAWLALEKA